MTTPKKTSSTNFEVKPLIEKVVPAQKIPEVIGQVDKHQDICHTHTDHECSIFDEILCHLPYAIFSVALGFIILSFLTFFGLGDASAAGTNKKGFHVLFHGFHFLHIIFATTGSLVAFSRFSNRIIKGLLVSLASALFFCTLSDIVLPYCAGLVFGMNMNFHICLYSEIHNIIPFLFVGLLNGFIMSQHDISSKSFYSKWSHFTHILISALASLFYVVGEGFEHWHHHMGLLFLVLIIAVVVPCTFADVIVPVFFARSKE